MHTPSILSPRKVGVVAVVVVEMQVGLERKKVPMLVLVLVVAPEMVKRVWMLKRLMPSLPMQ